MIFTEKYTKYERKSTNHELNIEKNQRINYDKVNKTAELVRSFSAVITCSVVSAADASNSIPYDGGNLTAYVSVNVSNQYYGSGTYTGSNYQDIMWCEGNVGGIGYKYGDTFSGTKMARNPKPASTYYSGASVSGSYSRTYARSTPTSDRYGVATSIM